MWQGDCVRILTEIQTGEFFILFRVLPVSTSFMVTAVIFPSSSFTRLVTRTWFAMVAPCRAAVIAKAMFIRESLWEPGNIGKIVCIVKACKFAVKAKTVTTGLNSNKVHNHNICLTHVHTYRNLFTKKIVSYRRSIQLLLWVYYVEALGKVRELVPCLGSRKISSIRVLRRNRRLWFPTSSTELATICRRVTWWAGGKRGVVRLPTSYCVRAKLPPPFYTAITYKETVKDFAFLSFILRTNSNLLKGNAC